jgi:hypothetical protein
MTTATPALLPSSPSERDLLRIDLPEDRYRLDLKLFEHGQSVSAELLKLALAGIAVVGFLLPLLVRPATSPGSVDGIFKILLAASVTCFAGAAGAALAQRYFASSAMFHHLKAMRFAYANNPAFDASTDDEIETRRIKFQRAHWLLKSAALLLALGAILLAGAFLRLLTIL